MLAPSALIGIILFQPQIPPNTGNIIRLCANCGYDLHLIKPLGFPLKDKQLQRAGLDYHEYATITIHNSWNGCKNYFNNRRIIAVETCGQKNYSDFQFFPKDVLIFGSETTGIPESILNQLAGNIVRLPMISGQRSLNLSNSVAVVAYESWRQLEFSQGA